MSDIDKPLTDEPLEQLLRHADPRATPDAVDTAAVRSAVRAEWQQVTGKRHKRRQVAGFALAATVLLVVFSSFNAFRFTAPDVVEVAVIQKSFGSISFVGERSMLTPASALTRVLSGQTIVTSDDAGIALAWGTGGSLRIDANTEVEFTGDDNIYLHSGQIYFDSQLSSLVAGIDAAGSPQLIIETQYGSVSHIGTQYMASIDGGSLAVSVREGEVAVDDRARTHTAASGQQLLFEGGRQPVRLSVNAYGGDWDWVANTAPPVDVDGKTIDEFLNWAGRELGYEVVYVTREIEQLAKTNLLRGTVNVNPAAALRARMMTADLVWQLEEGELYVGERD